LASNVSFFKTTLALATYPPLASPPAPPVPPVPPGRAALPPDPPLPARASPWIIELARVTVALEAYSPPQRSQFMESTGSWSGRAPRTRGDPSTKQSCSAADFSKGAGEWRVHLRAQVFQHVSEGACASA
jgi:hypothetical protein